MKQKQKERKTVPGVRKSKTETTLIAKQYVPLIQYSNKQYAYSNRRM